MSIKSIEISFTPFSVIAHKDEPASTALHKILNDVEWCSLADILYEDSTREFIGLSFAVDLGKESFAKNIVAISASAHCKYIVANDLAECIRYEGFGGNDRIELFWKLPSTAAKCLYASMFTGFWFTEINSEKKAKELMAPSGYYFADIEAVAVDYDLVLPTIQTQ